MMDDYDLGFTAREARLAKERDYWADRYRDSRLWRRQSDVEFEAGHLHGERLRERELEREEEAVEEVRAERREVRAERGLLGVAGFGLGGGAALLVVLGLLLMAIAYFGFGMFDGGLGGGGYGGPYDSEGYSPALAPYPAAMGGGYSGSELLSQRPMMFMGGGVLFLTGWILAMASRMRTFLTDDL